MVLTQKQKYILAQKQKYRTMEQDRKSRSKPIFMGTLFLTKETRIYNGAKIASSINGAGKTGQLHVRDVTFLLLFFFFFFFFHLFLLVGG